MEGGEKPGRGREGLLLTSQAEMGNVNGPCCRYKTVLAKNKGTQNLSSWLTQMLNLAGPGHRNDDRAVYP